MSINVCNNNSMSSITSLPSGVGGGALVLISTQTASSSSTISFTSGLDSTYKEYIFKFINIHPATAETWFRFNLSIDGGSNYNVTKTSSAFVAYHDEADSTYGKALTYHVHTDLAQSTSNQSLGYFTGTDNDASLCGTMHLFDPSNTTFVKHFIARTTNLNQDSGSSYAFEFNYAGYGNTTSAIDAVIFQMDSGNIDSGTIKLYGVS